MPRLIVNADDFGLTGGVNRAIFELHEAGVLTSATLMANAPRTAEAAGIALSAPTLGIGCHVVLVDGQPAARDVPSLAPNGRFYPKLSAFLMALYGGRIREEEIELEAEAQILNLKQQGLKLTHIDTHKHTHMFPRVLRPVLRAAKKCGVRAVRNPFEPAWSVAATANAPLQRMAQVRLLWALQPAFLKAVAEAGLKTTAGSLGVLATGTLNERTLAALLRAMPAGDEVYELVTHPGYNDSALAGANTRLLESREVERKALLGIRGSGVELVTFRDL